MFTLNGTASLFPEEPNNVCFWHFVPLTSILEPYNIRCIRGKKKKERKKKTKVGRDDSKICFCFDNYYQGHVQYDYQCYTKTVHDICMYCVSGFLMLKHSTVYNWQRPRSYVQFD